MPASAVTPVCSTGPAACSPPIRSMTPSPAYQATPSPSRLTARNRVRMGVRRLSRFTFSVNPISAAATCCHIVCKETSPGLPEAGESLAGRQVREVTACLKIGDTYSIAVPELSPNGKIPVTAAPDTVGHAHRHRHRCLAAPGERCSHNAGQNPRRTDPCRTPRENAHAGRSPHAALPHLSGDPYLGAALSRRPQDPGRFPARLHPYRHRGTAGVCSTALLRPARARFHDLLSHPLPPVRARTRADTRVVDVRLAQALPSSGGGNPGAHARRAGRARRPSLPRSPAVEPRRRRRCLASRSQGDADRPAPDLSLHGPCRRGEERGGLFAARRARHEVRGRRRPGPRQAAHGIPRRGLHRLSLRLGTGL